MLERKGDIPQLLAGDFNIDLLLDELVLRKKLENMMAAHCLSLISLREATRETETFSSGTNAIFGNAPLPKSTIEKATFFDHYSLHLKLDLEYEAIECIYRFRCSKNLWEQRLEQKNFILFSTHNGKIEETGPSGEAYITKIAEVLKRVRINIFLARISKRSLLGKRG